jgi:hypothetical protein
VNERARVQLVAIGEVHELLEHEGIEHVLFGGWAVDFYAGRVTRDHDDFDLAVWSEDAERIAVLVARAGFTHSPLPDEDGGTGYERGPVRVELTLLVRGEDGSARIRLRAGDVAWVERGLNGELLELDGTACHALGYAALVRTKSADRDDLRDRAKDVSDLTRLRGVEVDPPS